jgi:hypothetical protein
MQAKRLVACFGYGAFEDSMGLNTGIAGGSNKKNAAFGFQELSNGGPGLV